jgi:hypothetical protein
MYPTYDPHRTGSIGEYGVDIQNGIVYSPDTYIDYMGYGHTRWISPYRLKNLIDTNPRLAPIWIHERNPLDDIPPLVDPKHWWPFPPPGPLSPVDRYGMSPVISVSGLIDETGKVRVDSVGRVTASAALHAPEIRWNAQLICRSGDVAARARMTRVMAQGCGCGSSSSGPQNGNPNQLPLEFSGLIPDAELGIALRIIDRDGKEVWERHVPDTPVRFDSLEADLVNEATVWFAWCFETDDGFDVWAQYSADDGKTWRGLTSDHATGRQR